MEDASLKIPRDIIDAVVEKQVTLAISESLHGYPEILDKLVKQTLFMRVDDQGRPSLYSHNKTFVEWLINQTFRDMIIRVLKEELEKHSDAIREHIASELGRKNSKMLKQLSDAIVNGVTEASKYKWMFNVDVNIKE